MTQVCRECGCTNLSACAGGCWWVDDDLCSSCAAPMVSDLDLEDVIVVDRIGALVSAIVCSCEVLPGFGLDSAGCVMHGAPA